MRKEVILEEYVRKRTSGAKDRFKVLKKIYDEVHEGKLRIRDPNPPKDLIEYLRRPDYALWVWSTLALLALTLLAVATSNLMPLLKYLRYVLGSVMVLFIPGYVAIEALYPKDKDLSPLERLALSMGLSLAVVPLIGLLLNYTPWGIRLTSILASLTLYTLAVTMIAAYRKYKLVSSY